MKIALSLSVAACLTGSAFAGGYQHVDVFADSSNDLFDNGFANLDITSVTVGQNYLEDGEVQVDITVTTRGIADWTKYLVFMSSSYDPNGSGTNPWNRPIDLGGQTANAFLGAWIDGGSGGSNQIWGLVDGWTNFGSGIFGQSVDWANNSVTFSAVFESGQTVSFDVATSGGGNNDAGVDHLSRSDMAMGGWGQTSYAGQFLQFTVIPAPGAMGLMALAGVLGARRRR